MSLDLSSHEFKGRRNKHSSVKEWYEHAGRGKNWWQPSLEITSLPLTAGTRSVLFPAPGPVPSGVGTLSVWSKPLSNSLLMPRSGLCVCCMPSSPDQRADFSSLWCSSLGQLNGSYRTWWVWSERFPGHSLIGWKDMGRHCSSNHYGGMRGLESQLLVELQATH